MCSLCEMVELIKFQTILPDFNIFTLTVINRVILDYSQHSILEILFKLQSYID